MARALRPGYLIIRGLENPRHTLRVSQSESLLRRPTLPIRLPLDRCAQSGELLVKVFIPPVDVVDAVHRCCSFGDEAGEDEAGGGAEVAGHDGGAGEIFDALDDGAGAFFADLGPHAA